MHSDGIRLFIHVVVHRRLQSLDVSHNEIRVLPAGVWDLTDLKELHLQHNAIREIRGNISSMTQLQVRLYHTCSSDRLCRALSGSVAFHMQELSGSYMAYIGHAWLTLVIHGLHYMMLVLAVQARAWHNYSYGSTPHMQ